MAGRCRNTSVPACDPPQRWPGVARPGPDHDRHATDTNRHTTPTDALPGDSPLGPRTVARRTGGRRFGSHPDRRRTVLLRLDDQHSRRPGWSFSPGAELPVSVGNRSTRSRVVHPCGRGRATRTANRGTSTTSRGSRQRRTHGGGARYGGTNHWIRLARFPAEAGWSMGMDTRGSRGRISGRRERHRRGPEAPIPAQALVAARLPCWRAPQRARACRRAGPLRPPRRLRPRGAAEVCWLHGLSTCAAPPRMRSWAGARPRRRASIRGTPSAGGRGPVHTVAQADATRPRSPRLGRCRPMRARAHGRDRVRGCVRDLARPCSSSWRR